MKLPAVGRARYIFVALVTLVLLGAGFIGGALVDRSGLLPGSVTSEPAGVASTFSPFWESWDLVQKYYVDRSSVNATTMTYGATQGMLDSLGDVGHTRFLSPDDLKAEQQAISGEIEGIGAQIGIRSGQPTIVAPIPGSPAQKAGVRPGDVIIRVDGKEVVGLTLEQVVNMVRGPAGTEVTLTVVHEGQTVLTDIKITRAKITVPSVTWAILPGTTVAHILISQFAENCTDDLVKALAAAKAAGANAIVLDLRNDPGGLENEAIGVASQFLRGGNVLLTQDAQGKRTPEPVRPDGVAPDLPMVLLINEGTASSSEIVAGAIQDQKRAVLVGTTTFGTGTVLSTYNLSDGSAILLGTSEWLTPDGRRIWHQGITPDIQVQLPPDGVPLLPEEESTMTAQELQTSKDAQLLRALQEVTGPAPSP